MTDFKIMGPEIIAHHVCTGFRTMRMDNPTALFWLASRELLENVMAGLVGAVRP